MEGAPRTHESDVMHFCVIAIIETLSNYEAEQDNI